ncbi:MAG: ribosome silencing factor [Phycisphaerales bacterium]|nr:ribosome silencing factor [Phycisphaerales bacterium]
MKRAGTKLEVLRTKSERARIKSQASDTSSAKSFAITAAKLMSELKCSDVVILDLVGRSQICDYMLVVTGTSQRQMRSVGDEVDKVAKAQGSGAWRTSADTGSSWIVLDFVDVVVHLFEPNQRAFYDIEGLWSDAPRLNWRPAATK